MTSVAGIASLTLRVVPVSAVLVSYAFLTGVHRAVP